MGGNNKDTSNKNSDMSEPEVKSSKNADVTENDISDSGNGPQEGEDLYPLALLMDGLKHDDIGNRVEAMKKLDTIAVALGPQRARDELIPFLSEVAQDDEDEIFNVLAEQLGKFVPFIGGSKFATLLLPALEILASTEETLVRDKAVESLNNVAQELSEDQLFHDFIPLIEHLATADWFSSKVSSCGLFRAVLVRVKDDKFRKELLALYLQLVQDDTPMVRRAAGKNLPVLIDLLTQNPDLSTSDDWDYISSMFQKIMTDGQDSVKFLAVDVLISILKFFSKKHDTTHSKDLLRSAIQLIGDESWRVRYMAAEHFEELAHQFIATPRYIDELSGPFLALCEDNESDVRKGVAKQLPGFAKLLGDPQVVLKKVLPVVQNLSMDESEMVRASLASEITNLAPLVPKQDAIETLIPILLNMLRDEYPDVRLNIIAKLKVVNEVVGIDLLSENLLPAITELAKDANWRVRMAIIDYVPLLAEQLGVEFFDKQLGDLCLSWLWDTVYSIRKAAVTNLKNLTEIFGSDWASEKIISRLLTSDSQLLENFVYRITLLHALTELVPVISNDVITQKVLPFINHLTEDAVPNIRFNVAKSYVSVVESLCADKSKNKDLIQSTIVTSLEKLSHDNDVDVRYFAAESLTKSKALLA